MDIQELRDSPKSWQQDFDLENGDYVCNCTICKSDFIGHKRRVVCRECQKKLKGTLTEKHPPEIIKVVEMTPWGESFYRSIEHAWREFWSKAIYYDLQDVNIIIDDSPYYGHLKHPPIIIVGKYRPEEPL